MTRALVLGNGNMLVCLDRQNRVRDFYYPHVGQENHVGGSVHKTGVWVDGTISWVFESPGWEGSLQYKPEALVSSVKATNKEHYIKLEMEDAVHHEKNIFLRKVVVYNEAPHARKMKLFFNQIFRIFEGNVGDTAYYHSIEKALIHYKGKRYFLVNGCTDDHGFDDFATGMADVNGLQGTYVDAEDGVLSKNLIEHGTVDSTLGFTLEIPAHASKTVYYWVAVGNRFNEVRTLNRVVLGQSPDALFRQTEKYWRQWVNTQKFTFIDVNEKMIDLFKRSLLIVKTQTDSGGAFIAANDTDTLYFKRDTYSYMWPRDGALIARSLDKSGQGIMTEKFFEFCNDVTSSEGYLLHKYRPDKSLGSSWHPWLKGSKIQLPIQEDETALVLDSLWKKYAQYGDDQYISPLYESFIRKAGDFLVRFRDPKTGLPKESYDLWEEKLGVHTFTCATVYAGLQAAKRFAEIFGTKFDARKYGVAAEEVRAAIINHLYDESSGVFIKGISYDENGVPKRDMTPDMSTGYGIFEYEVLDVHDPRVKQTMDMLKEKLLCHTQSGGYARYQGDMYYRVSDGVPGNSWFISTLWVAEYMIHAAQNHTELQEALKLFDWVTQRALPSGILSEQVHPHTGEPLSVAPLTWSHAGFIIAVIKYFDKLQELGVGNPYAQSSVIKKRAPRKVSHATNV